MWCDKPRRARLIKKVAVGLSSIAPGGLEAVMLFRPNSQYLEKTSDAKSFHSFFLAMALAACGQKWHEAFNESRFDMLKLPQATQFTYEQKAAFIDACMRAQKNGSLLLFAETRQTQPKAFFPPEANFSHLCLALQTAPTKSERNVKIHRSHSGQRRRGQLAHRKFLTD